MQANIYGKKSEIIATNYLKKKGYKILKNNYKNKIGEIDIIAKDKDTIVFVEVKARMSSKFGDPLEAINIHKQRKIIQVAQIYLLKNKLTDVSSRFDAVAILGELDSEIRHIENAFEIN